ncbi:hypothetical protein skT53_20180 [Effusibacillus dendaii]|uniref:Uncharacterized protein n=1 Tax=Effusibacillus dendaii TaxID=2743772 RepID=A0A7I8DA29_9BACL|nr:hypothetical protein skT53_20180 [Effusibacillus dendaii]
MALILIINRPVRWYKGLFNCVQYGISAYFALQSYQVTGGVIGDFQLESLFAYLSYAIVYFCVIPVYV